MIIKAKQKVHLQLIKLTKRYFDLLAKSKYEDIYENLFTDESIELLSTMAWPLICYKEKKLDFLMDSQQNLNVNIPIHDALSMAFQMDIEECRTGLFRGIAESLLLQGWYKFNAQKSFSFINGQAALLVADAAPVPVIMPFVKNGNDYLIDFEFLWLFSMEMRASLLLELSLHAQQYNNHKLMLAFLRLAARLAVPYRRIENLMLKNPFVEQLLTPTRKQEIVNETKHSYEAQKRLDSISSLTIIKVLFFAANPIDQKQLRLDEEIRNRFYRK